MKSKSKRIAGYILLAVLVLVGGVAIYIYKEYNRKVKDTASLKTDFSLTAKILVDEFEKNDSLAGRKYLDKVIEVGGQVKDISKEDNGFLTVSLGDSTYSTSIRCSVDSTHSKELQLVKQNQLVLLKGICTGFNRDELLGSDVFLVRCVLINNN
ncbi:MAG: hypothetical protein IPQ08_07340 [Chitinophagaceae bacterium]|nr:hypothetical protein [Chitinophagaceae bacterium]